MAIESRDLTRAEKPGFWHSVFDWLFGYDYFLAHRSLDGKDYASALYDALNPEQGVEGGLYSPDGHNVS